MAAVSITARDHDRPAPPRLLAEALVGIVRASVAVRLLPFKDLDRRLTAEVDGVPVDAETAYWIRRAVLAWGRRLPWRTKCFEQGLAAAAMLRRRGFAATVHYGAARADDRLLAHVWVTSGPIPVVGHENRDDFAALARLGE